MKSHGCSPRGATEASATRVPLGCLRYNPRANRRRSGSLVEAVVGVAGSRRGALWDRQRMGKPAVDHRLPATRRMGTPLRRCSPTTITRGRIAPVSDSLGGIPLPASTDRGPAPPLDDCRGIAAASAVLGSVVVWAVRVVRQRRIPLTPLIPSETLLSGIVSVFYVVRCLDCSVAEQGKPIRLEARITTAISLGVGRPSYENVP